jgi:integrase
MTSRNDREQVSERVTIYSRGKKRIYVADFFDGTRHRRQSLRTTNKKVAKDRALAIANDLVHGQYQPPPAAVDVADAYDQYLTYLMTENRAKKTLVKYRGVFENFTSFLAKNGVTKLGQVTALHFDRFRASRTGVKHSKTLYTEGVILKQLFRWAKTRKLIAENPLADVKLHKPKPGPKPDLSLAQVNQLLAAADEVLRPRLAVLTFTGIRAGELRRLRRADIDLVGNWVRVRCRPGEPTKNGKERKIPIHARLRPQLEWAVRSAGPYLFTVSPSRKYPEGGRPLNLKRLNEQFGRLADRLGLPVGRKQNGVVVHTLRHFFKSFAINRGRVPDRAVDNWMGHDKDQTVAGMYYRLPDTESQAFMAEVPFGTGHPAADAGTEG